MLVLPYTVFRMQKQRALADSMSQDPDSTMRCGVFDAYLHPMVLAALWSLRALPGCFKSFRVVRPVFVYDVSNPRFIHACPRVPYYP